MPDYLGADQRKVKEEKKEDKPIQGKIEYKSMNISCRKLRYDT